MDMPATQIIDDDDENRTQIIDSSIKEKKRRQIGILQIGSKTYPINTGINKIGRHPACEVYLTDDTISKQHAEIEASSSEASVWICDLNSSNKTKLNNTILRGGRLYQLNNGSVIKFGRVQAVYKSSDPVDDSVILETPLRVRQKTQQGVIPATPDSFLNSSSSENDVSTIPGTQGYDEPTMFRCPSMLRHKSRINTSSHSANQTPDKDGCARVSVVSKTYSNREINIHGMETQKTFEEQIDIDNDLYDVETHRICLDNGMKDRGNSNASVVSNIHEMETQIDMEIFHAKNQSKISDIHEMETQIDMEMLPAKNQSKISDIHEMETQIDMEMLPAKNQSKISDIHEMETQPIIDLPKSIVTDTGNIIKNIESDKANTDTELKRDSKTQVERKMSDANDYEDSISEMETQKIDPQRLKDMLRSAKEISAKEMPENKMNENINNEHGNSDTKGSSHPRDITSSPQEPLHLSLASDFEENCSDLDVSTNKSGSPILMADLDGHALADHPIASTSKEQVLSESSDEESIFDALTQEAPENLEMRKSIPQHSSNVHNNVQLNEDSETDEEGVFCQFSHRERRQNTKKLNESNVPNSEDAHKPADTVKDAVVDDMAPTQIINLKTNNTDTTESSSSSSSERIGLYSATICGIENIEYEMAPTQLIDEAQLNKETVAKNKGENNEKKSRKNLQGESKSRYKINLNDTIERNLNEMFEDINSENYDEPLPLSTQCLEDALAPKPRESDSQNSDNYFSTLLSVRKQNVLKDSQDTAESNDNGAKSSGTKNSTENKSESDLAVNTSKLNRSVAANNEKAIEPSEKQSSESSSPSNKNQQQDCDKLNGIQLANELTDSEITETSVPMEMPIFVDTEDIMAGLPEVRISGTLSNPPSPTSSISSWSCISRDREKPKRNTEKTKVKATAKAKRRKKNVETIRNTRSTNLTVNVFNSFPRDLSMCNVSVKVVRCDDMLENINPQAIESSESKRFVRRSFKHDVTQDGLPLQQKSISLNLSLTENLHDSLINVSKVSLSRNSRTSHHSNVKNGDRSYIFQVTNAVPEEKVESEAPKRTGANVSHRGKRSHNKIDQVPESPVKKRKVSLAKKNEVKLKEDVPRSTRGRRSNVTKATNSTQSPTIPMFFSKRVSPVIVDSSKNTVELNDAETSSKNVVAKEAKTFVSSTNASLKNVPPKKRVRRAEYKDDETKDSSGDITGNTVNKNIRMSETKILKSRNKKQEPDASVKTVGEESQEVEMIMNRSLANEKNKTEDKVELHPQGKRTRGRKRTIVDRSAVSNVDEKELIESSLTEERPVSKAPTAKPKRTRVTNRTTTSVVTQYEETVTNNQVSSRLTRSSSVQKSLTDSSMKDTINTSVLENTVAKSSVPAKPRGRGRKRKEEINEEEVQAQDASIHDTSIMLIPDRKRRTVSSASSFSMSPSRTKHKILFTGITNNEYQKIITKLGASQVEDPAKCTVLVTDKVRRTVKFLCALAKCKPIVSVNWLLESEKVGQFIDLNDYLLHDTEAEAKFGFKLKESLEKAKEHSLLSGYSVILTPNVAPPPLPELKSIISACGGKPLIRSPTSWPEKSVIISRKEDTANARKISAKAPKHVTVQSTEFILTGILRQNLNFTEFRLY